MLLATKVETLVDEQTSLAMLITPSVNSVGLNIPSVEDLSQPVSGPTATIIDSAARPPRSSRQYEDIPMQSNGRGDLDWSYTSRCIRRWSPNSLLTQLYSHAFSVPPKISSPFVNMNLVSQDGDEPEVVSLPHAYRLPLLMVAKYLWETVFSALSAGRDEWVAQTTNVFHISRLCENLFASARIKTVKGGMERGWRCLAFDRFLTRFYKHWIQNDPASNEIFWKKHGPQEYDRDVLRHDWKRWSLRGLNGIRLTEQEVNLGLNADQFRKTLILDRETHTWTLEGKALSFITSDEGLAWSSVSELTDIDLEEADEEMKPSLHLSPRRLKLFAQPRKLPDPARLSTLRKSARTGSALSSPCISGPSSAISQTTPFPETGSAQTFSSSRPIQTPVQSSSRKQSSSGLVVRIQRRAQVTQTGSPTQSLLKSSNAERSNVAPSATDPSQPVLPPSTLSKRVSRPSLRRGEIENDPASRTKRRRIDEFEIGKGKEKDDFPTQTSTHRTPCSTTSIPGANTVSYNLVQPSVRVERDTQRANSMRVEVSVQTVPMVIAIEQGTQTDDISIGSEVHVDRDVVKCDSIRMPTTTKRTTSDIAIQAELNPLRDNNSVKPDEIGNDGFTAEMRNSLSLVVDNLVSSRLVSLMRALKQSSEPGPTLGSGISSSPTSCDSSALSSARGTSGMDGHMVNGLFDDLRLLREEAHAREQRTREEMRALQHLHNAEVDSLRRRLAYLESQSDEQVVRDYDTRRANGECSHRGRQTHYNNDNRTPRFGDKRYHSRNDDIVKSSFGVRSLRSPDLPVAGPLSNDNDLSGGFLSTRSGNAMEEDSPLPSKAQRKSHIIPFSRPSVAG